MLTGGLGSEKNGITAVPGHLGVGPAFEGAVGNEDHGSASLVFCRTLGEV